MSTTLRTIPATVSPDGSVRLFEPIELNGSVAAVVTIALESAATEEEPAILAEPALEDWIRKEEDEAWDYLREVM
jgi:hypothetical protein